MKRGGLPVELGGLLPTVKQEAGRVAWLPIGPVVQSGDRLATLTHA